jgi:hypothetical protein
MRPQPRALGLRAVWAFLVGLAIVVPVGVLAAPAIVIESARFGNTFEIGDSPALTVRVVPEAGQAFRGRLHVRIRDAYGKPAGRLRAGVELAAGATGTWTVPIASARIGHFQLEATLLGADRRPAASGSTTAGIVPPPPTSPAADSAVGYYVVPARSERGQADAIAAQMRQLGLRWVRLGYNWVDDARRSRPDLDDPAWLDTEDFEFWVDAFRAHDIEVLGVVFGVARWASSRPDDETVDNDRITYPRWGLVAPADPADWDTFMRTLAGRVRGRVRAWELWNEPDIFYFWRSSADEFALLLQRTAAAVREIDPAARVVLNFVDQGTPESVAFQDRVLAVAGTEIDVFGWHYGNLELITAAKATVPRLRAGASLWNTEAYGAPRRLISRWLEQRSAGIERLFPFIYHLPVDDAALGLIRFGLYPINVDYTPRHDAIAVRTLSDLVGSAVPLGGGAAGRGYFAYRFATGDGEVAALVDGNDPGLTWMPDASAVLQLRLPAGIRRVEIIDLMGNRTRRRVHARRLTVPMLGVATFLRAEPAASLPDIEVVRSRRRRG